MGPTNRPVTSREYKLILEAGRFRDRFEGTRTFWNLVMFLVHKEGGEIYREQNKEMKRRTCYLDTPGLDLRRRQLALRVREEGGGDEVMTKVTLKHRDPDRYISASQDLSTSIKKSKNKFEEDVLPPFTSKFSQSTSVKYKKPPKLDRIDRVTSVFQGIAAFNIPGDTPVERVNGFQPYEIARWVGKLKFGQEPILKAVLSFWYLIGKNTAEELPLIVEFSFDYDLPEDTRDDPSRLEYYPIAVVSGAYRLFRALQRQSEWVRFDATTKTAYAYESL